MNTDHLTPTEATFLIHAIEKSLRDGHELTTKQKQFYESIQESLNAKLSRVLRSGDGSTYIKPRNKHSKLPESWANH